jgi:mRNA-degrading endonuclease HigB of HigAB toxin-antitoxin module
VGSRQNFFYRTTPFKSIVGRGTHVFLKFFMKKNPTAEELLKELENRLSKGDFKDSVHKIKLMTARDMILEIISK